MCIQEGGDACDTACPVNVSVSVRLSVSVGSIIAEVMFANQSAGRYREFGKVEQHHHDRQYKLAAGMAFIKFMSRHTVGRSDTLGHVVDGEGRLPISNPWPPT